MPPSQATGVVASAPECHRLDLAGLKRFVESRAASMDREAARNPFAMAAWVSTYLDHCADATCSYAAVGSDVAGWSLLQRSNASHEWRALSNYYASLWTPWSGEDSAKSVLRQPANWPGAVVNLMPLALTDAALLAAQWRKQGWLVRQYDCFSNWTLPCAGQSFADFMAARPGQLLSTWRRKARRFERSDDGARLQLVQSPEEVDAGMDAYEAVYVRSWKNAEPFPGFIRAWARRCAERGWLRLGLAWAGDTPVAAQFWFTMGGRAYIFKLAYDEAYKTWSAGTVLSAFMFEQALDRDRVVEVDYLTGDDAYKSHWMNTRQQRVGLVACNPRQPVGLLRGGKEWLGAATARWRTPAVSA